MDDVFQILLLSPCVAGLGLAVITASMVAGLLLGMWLLRLVWVVHERRRRSRLYMLWHRVPAAWKPVYQQTPLYGVTARELGFGPDGQIPGTDWCEKPWWADIGEVNRQAPSNLVRTDPPAPSMLVRMAS